MLFWTELDQIDGFKLNGVHVSQRSYTCETLCACCFRKGISAAEVVSYFKRKILSRWYDITFSAGFTRVLLVSARSLSAS